MVDVKLSACMVLTNKGKYCECYTKCVLNVQSKKTLLLLSVMHFSL